MLESYCRSQYQRWFVIPIATRLGPKITPNQITCIAGFIGMMALPALFFNFPVIAGILVLLSGYFDTLDGTLARLKHTVSDMGSILDIIFDRIVEFAIIFGLFTVDPMHRAWMALLMLGSILICITSFLVVGIFTPNTSEKGFHYSPGLMERAEAFIFFLLMIFLPSAFNELALCFSLLVMFTTVQRLFQFYKQQDISV